MQSQNIPLAIEVIGSGAEFHQTNLQPFIEALGSYIWAKTPIILLKLNQIIDDPKLINDFKKLYAKQPLFYQNLENIFQTNSQKH